MRNNEGNLSPTNPASINKKTILISIPSPEDDTNLSGFARKLEMAFKNSIPHGNAVFFFPQMYLLSIRIEASEKCMSEHVADKRIKPETAGFDWCDELVTELRGKD